jgi:hypothetical protein
MFVYWLIGNMYDWKADLEYSPVARIINKQGAIHGGHAGADTILWCALKLMMAMLAWF